MIDNRKFKDSDVEDYYLRIALNCYYAEAECTYKLARKCRQMNPKVWEKCPKNRKNNGRMDFREDR